MVRLRELEAASLALEEDTDNTADGGDAWLQLLIAPGGSLGGARPKASVVDEDGFLWIAKFPSPRDRVDVGGWELVLNTLARGAGLQLPESQARKFASANHTFMVRRFDRTASGRRQHMASAMTLTGHQDGDGASTGVSYLELADVLIQNGVQPEVDLQELWRRIVFNLLVSNTDDHLRNHAFLLESGLGWRLAPAYDLNPDPTGTGLHLNITASDNALDLELVMAVAANFRIAQKQARLDIERMQQVVRSWRRIAIAIGISSGEQERMADAFRLA
jgi:serine/threonine-protein kinase HipA